MARKAREDKVSEFASLPVSEQREKKIQLQAKLAYMRDKDREPIKGKFKYYECPGGIMKFCFKKYKQDEVAHYSLVDGEVCTIPLGVAKHLNKNCFNTIYEYAYDAGGRAVQQVGKRVQRCEFIPMEFCDMDDLTPAGSSGIVTVENI